MGIFRQAQELSGEEHTPSYILRDATYVIRPTVYEPLMTLVGPSVFEEASAEERASMWERAEEATRQIREATPGQEARRIEVAQRLMALMKGSEGRPIKPSQHS